MKKKGFLQSFSMRKKLMLAFILMTAVPLLVTTLFTSYVSYTSLKADTFEANQRIATALAREIDQQLDAKLKLLLIMANNPVIQSMNPPAQLPVLRSIANQYSEMPSLIVADAKGMQIVRTVGNLASVADRDYFQELVKGANFVISDPVTAKGTGLKSIIIGVPIKDSSNTMKGVLLGVVDIQYLSNYIAQTRIGETGYPFIVDKKGIALAHPNKEVIEKAQDLRSFGVAEALAGKTGVTQYEWNGEKRLAGYSYVPTAGWGVAVQQPLNEALSAANKILLTGVVITLGAIMLAVIVGLMLAKIFTKPLLRLNEATARLADGDLTVTVDIKSADEIGQLAQSFNSMAANLKALIRGVINTADHVAASAEELTATSTEAERAISQISGTVNEFAQGAQQQTSDVSDMVHIVDGLTETAQMVSAKAQTASTLSREMAEAAHAGEQATGNAIRNINEIKEVTENTSAAVSSLGVKSQQIGQIVDVITGIAGQTNLLALNAAIEAARAGEQGRGFAVVADEVRKLAEQSEQAARQISDIIQEIREQTDEAIVAMKEGNIKVKTGVEVVKTAGDTLNSIIAKVENSVHTMQDIAAAVEQQVAGTRTVAASTEHIAVIARQSSANAEHTAASTQEITASMTEISGAAHGLANAATELQSLVAKFRI